MRLSMNVSSNANLLCVLGSLLLEVVFRRSQSGGKRIGARDLGLCQNMAI
jgi:hypothetical protein